MTIKEISPDEYAAFFARYMEAVDVDMELRRGMKMTRQQIIDFFAGLAEDKGDFRYAADKWTIKEVLQHVIDTERILAYRLLRLGRRDQTPISGFNQDIYNIHAGAQEKSMHKLIEEFRLTRQQTESILEGLSDRNLQFIGTSSDEALSARAAAFIIIGHAAWHLRIIRDLYL